MRKHVPLSMILGLALAIVPLATGCQSDTTLADRAPVSPAAAQEIPPFPGSGHFAPQITNPYMNFAPGRTFTYRTETDAGTEINTVRITDSTETIVGVVVTVVHDQVFLNGERTEDTFDWMAQDEDGNVWYFGEDTKVYSGGQLISTEGSWRAGVNGNPGIIMLADPEVGQRYKQEDSPGVAEDMAKVLSLHATVDIDYGTWDNALQTAEWSLVESGPRDFKFYVSGVGMVMEIGGRGSHEERTVLTAIN